MWHHLDIADIERALRKVTMLHKVITSSPFMIIVIFWDCYFHVMWQPAVLLIEIVYALEWVLKMLEKFTLWTNGGGQKKNSFPEKVFTCQSPAWPITQVNLNILMCHHFDFGCHLRKSMVPQMLRRHRSITPSNQPNLITCVTLMMIMVTMLVKMKMMMLVSGTFPFLVSTTSSFSSLCFTWRPNYNFAKM